MISLQKATGKNVRETTADFTTMDGDEIKTEKIRVRYYDFTTKELREQKAAFDAKTADDPNAVVWNTENLIQRLHSLPDIVDENEKPVEITIDFLDSLEITNLNSIKEAINRDLNPKSTPAS